MTDYPLTSWRLLLTPPARGAWNMAVDEAILEAVIDGAALPTLRLYAWQPACLSLGYAQPWADADPLRLADYGWDIVRRPTGGRAILHTDELTYAVIGPAADPRLTGSVLESYQRLSAALLAALHRLDVPAQANHLPLTPESTPPDGSPEGKNPVCFEAPSHYEITLNEKKLLGSAQARRKSGVLQHGTLPLFGDLTRIAQVLAFPDEDARRAAAARILTRATTVAGGLGYSLPWGVVAQAFSVAFRDTLNLYLLPSELSPEEKSRAIELTQEKYDHPNWTKRI